MSILEIVIYSCLGVGFIIWTTLTIISEVKKRKNKSKKDDEDED